MGTQSRDFTYIDNVVQGNLLACVAAEAVGETINLATGGRIVLKDLVAQLNEILGTSLDPIYAEAPLGRYQAFASGCGEGARLAGL